MGISFFSKKNRAFILGISAFYSFLIISIILLTQILLNSKISLLKEDINSIQEQANINLLEEILDEEIRDIEKFSIKNIKISSYFDTSINNQKIFLEQEPHKVSIGGYFSNENVKQKLEDSFKNNINLTFRKEISIDNTSYLIQTTINYQSNFSKNPKDLKDEIIKRIWIMKYE